MTYYSTFLHLAIFAYQHNLGRCFLNRPCTVHVLLSCTRLDVVLFLPDMFL